MNGLFLWRALTVSKQQNVAEHFCLKVLLLHHIYSFKRVNFDES